MEIPLHISIRGVPQSKALEATIRKSAAKLQTLHARISSCRVAIEQVRGEGREGIRFDVRIDIRTPGGQEALSSAAQHEDMHVALRDAFAATRKQLEATHTVKH
jgi:ribosome-associated translation inhibitor RaiA